MCMSTPKMSMPEMPEPPPPPPPPAPPAPPAQTGAIESQGVAERPGSKGNRKLKDRNSLRIPMNQARGVNLPGSGGGR